MSKRTVIAVIAAVVAVVVVVGVIVAATGDDRSHTDAGTTSDVTTSAPTDEAVAAFAPGRPLGELRAVAADLASLTDPTAAAAECAVAVDRLDRTGTPEELFALALAVADPDLAETALEQHAAVSSALAACRGEAPIGLADAAAELAVTNAALEALLEEKAR